MKKLLFFSLLMLAIGGSLSAQTPISIVAGVVTADVGRSSNYKILVNQTVTSVVFTSISMPAAGQNVSLFFTENATGGFSVAFGGNISNPCTVVTTASTTTVCQFQYDATSATWFGVGGGGGITSVASLPGGSQFYLATSCPATTPTCFVVKDDTQIVLDAVFNTSTTVTTSAGDVPFACQGSAYPCSSAGVGSDVGKIEWGTTNCSFSVAGGCVTTCPQGTITTVNSAHSVTVSPACTGNSVGSVSPFQWGSDDGAQIVASVNAMLAKQTAKSGTSANLRLPCGSMMTSVNPFILNQVGTPMSFSITGCGSGTMIVPTPKMNCNVGAGHGCLIDAPAATYATTGFTPAGVFRDITFWGGGTNTHDAAATVSANSSGIFTNFEYGLDNVWVIGWLWNDSVTSLVGMTNVGSQWWNSGSFTGGTIGCAFRGAAQTIAQMHGGTCGGSNGPAIQVSQTGGPNDETDLFGVYEQGGGNSVLSGSLHDYGSIHVSVIQLSAGATAWFHGTWMNNIAVQTAGDLHLQQTHWTTNANIVQTAGRVFDDCGNDTPSPAFSSYTALFGNSCSVTGTALVAGNLVPSANWGTGAAISVPKGDSQNFSFTLTNGSAATGANPTIAFTYPAQFWKTPICTVQQVGGTAPITALTALLAPTGGTATTVTLNYVGTPTANQTEFYQGSCH